MGSIHFVGGEKGGVGKSVVARLLVQYCIDHAVPFVAMDADPSHPSMLRYYEDASRPVSLTERASMDQIAERALEEDKRVIVDLPAQAASELHAWIDGGDVIEFARESGIRLLQWHVSDGGYDSVRLLGALVAQYGKESRYVVVRNHGRSRNFDQLDESAEFAAVRSLSASVFDLPELEPGVMYVVDRTGSSFWSAADDSNAPSRLSALDRRRARKWLRECYKRLDMLEDVL